MLDFALPILAFLPILFFLYMEFVRGISQKHVIPPTLLLTASLAFVVWRVDILQIIASALQGFFWGFEIIYIVLAVIFIGRAIAQSNTLTVIRTWFTQISPDRRVQAILISWFLGSALDCIIGFSTTSGISCTLMAGIGFPPACAIMAGIMGIIAANAFCSSGTPMTLAMTHGLSDPVFTKRLLAAGYNLHDYILLVSGKVALIHGIAGTFIPLMIIMMMSRFFGRNKSWTEGLSMAPFAIFSGLAFTIPYALTAIYFGPEFPSLVGGLVGLAICVTAVRLKFLIPHDIWEFPPKDEWRKDWFAGKYNPPPTEWMPLWKTLFPFTSLTILVLVTCWPGTFLPKFLQSHDFSWPHFLGSSITLSFRTLSNHGTLLVVAFFLCMILYHHVREHVNAAVTPTFVITASMIMRLPLMLAIASIYFNSSVNHAHLPGMPESLAHGIAQIPGASILSPFLVPFIAASLCHLFDAHAFSNVIASNFQFYLGNTWGWGTLFLALQMAGASVGNLTGMHYLAGTGVTVGMIGWESPTMRRLTFALFTYLIIVGLVGIFLAYVWHSPDPVQIGF